MVTGEGATPQNRSLAISSNFRFLLTYNSPSSAPVRVQLFRKISVWAAFLGPRCDQFIDFLGAP